jgi:protein arginine N-methyltransferase 1
VIELQRLLLGDTGRNDAFSKALKAVITPNVTTVNDLGSGTGYLSFLAEKFGAKHCTLYEVSSDLLALSKELGRANGMKRCTYVGGYSTDAKNPKKADLVVSETLGNWAYEENIIETLNDAGRFLAPGGVVIPEALRCFVVPVVGKRLWDDVNVWGSVGFDFSAAQTICMQNMFVKDVTPEDLAGKDTIKEWDAVDFRKKNKSVREGTIEWNADIGKILYGYACFWEANLGNGITLSTSPYAKPTHWKQIYLPLLEPLDLKKAKTIRLTLISDSRPQVKINVTWTTRLMDGAGKTIKEMRQDMRKGQIG